MSCARIFRYHYPDVLVAELCIQSHTKVVKSSIVARHYVGVGKGSLDDLTNSQIPDFIMS